VLRARVGMFFKQNPNKVLTAFLVTPSAQLSEIEVGPLPSFR